MLSKTFFSYNQSPAIHGVTQASPSGCSCLDNILTNLSSSEYQALVQNISLSNRKDRIVVFYN